MTHTSRPRFTKVRMREGYSTDEVDAFLDAVERDMHGPLPNSEIAHRLMHETFTPVRLRDGYDMGEVDAYIDGLMRRVEGGSSEVPAYVPPAGSTYSPTPRIGGSTTPEFSFRTTRFRDGYSVTEVDAFLATVMQGLAGRLPNEPLARYIGGARFSPVSMPQRGYRMEDVDQQLDKLRQWALTGRRPS